MTHGAQQGKRVILHAGLAKTGSTSMQVALAKFRPRLLGEAGVLYPGISHNHARTFDAFVATKRVGLWRMWSLKVTDKQEFRLAALRALENVAREIHASDAHTVVVSSEIVPRMRPGELAALREWLCRFDPNPCVVVCVREPVSHAKSAVQQSLKAGEVLETLYANPPLPQFERRLGGLIDAFGHGNITVEPFERWAKSAHGPIGALLAHLDLPHGLARDLVAAQTHENQSLTSVEALLLSRLNRVVPKHVNGGASPQRTHVEHLQVRGLGGAKFALPPSVAQRVFDGSRDDVAWLNRTFGLSLYTEPPADLTGVATQPSDDELLDATTRAYGDALVKLRAAEIRRALNEARRNGNPERANVLRAELRRLGARPTPSAVGWDDPLAELAFAPSDDR